MKNSMLLNWFVGLCVKIQYKSAQPINYFCLFIFLKKVHVTFIVDLKKENQISLKKYNFFYN